MKINLKILIRMRHINAMSQVKMVEAMKLRNVKMNESKYVSLEKGKTDWKFAELWAFCKICNLNKKQMRELINL